MTELKELSSYLLSSIYNAISLIVLSFILSNKPSILQYVFTCVLSLFMSSFAQYMNPLSSISSYVYDTFFLIIWLVIPVSIKYYHDFITKKLEKQHKELKKIKFFYMTWLKNLNICYLLLKKEDVIFSNNHFDSINRTYFDEEHISPKDFFQKAFLFQTNVNVLENEKINLLECIKKVEVESKKDFIKIGSFKFVNRKGKEEKDLFFEVHIKFYEGEYKEVLLTDITNLIESQQKQLEQRYKNMVFAKIAHEFKTPISSIIGVIEKINENFNSTPINQIIKKDLVVITNLSKFVLYLINDITTYARSNINIDISKAKCSLNEVVTFLFKILEVLLSTNESKNENIKPVLENRLENKNKFIFTDEIRLKQILLNFVSNAVKFTLSGSIQIVVDQNLDDKISISVTDTGRGMDEETLKSLFKDDNEMIVRDEYNQMGSGLGLKIASSLAEHIDCKIEVESKRNQGSSFTVTLDQDSELFSPVSRNSSMITIKKKPSFHEEEFRLVTAFSKVHVETEEDESAIICADDNLMIRNSLGKMLAQIAKRTKKKWKIVQVSDGIFAVSELLSLVQKGVRIDAIILDEYMEFLSGSQSAKILRQLIDESKIRDFPIFSCSAFADEAYLNKVKEAGINEILSKPATMKQLEEIFMEYKVV